MSTLLIVRHGNTFEAGETAVRVGLKTDLPLSSSGIQQAKNLGYFLKQRKIIPAQVYVSDLQRTQQMADIALQIAGLDIAVTSNSMFNEIDYAIDEGKTNEQIIARIGKAALDAWEDAAIPPPGWLIDPQNIINAWKDFANAIPNNDTVLVVTSNGIARFAPYLTKNFKQFSKQHKIKLATGAMGSLTRQAEVWKLDFWNETP